MRQCHMRPRAISRPHVTHPIQFEKIVRPLLPHHHRQVYTPGGEWPHEDLCACEAT